jgi:hypothetical protein
MKENVAPFQVLIPAKTIRQEELARKSFCQSEGFVNEKLSFVADSIHNIQIELVTINKNISITDDQKWCILH